MRYVALLRGINVGGNNKIAMSELKLLCQELGFHEVSTYINSGNVFFETVLTDINELQVMIEKAIMTSFGLKIPVLIRSKHQVDITLAAVPEAWENDKIQKTDVLFLWNEIDTSETLTLLNPKSGTDNAIYTPGAIIWHIAREHAGKSSLYKLVGTSIYKQMTIRNITSLRAIASRL